MPGTWPNQRSAILDWLIHETTAEPFIDNLLVALCERLALAGIPVARSNLIVRTNHPQWLGARMLWRPGMTSAELRRLDYDGLDRLVYTKSPAKAVIDGAAEVRGIIHALSPDSDPYPLYDELRRDGLTDYVAWPLPFTRGQAPVLSFATDRAGGFTDDHMTFLRDLVPVFAALTEIRLRNRLARTYLETYVGPHASEAILAGATRRGSGSTVRAVIVICDLRGFTAISEAWPRDDVIGMLNDYFDAMSEPIERHGGEILKFMGDGLLAIFPLDANAPAEALGAVIEARAAMAALNVTRAAKNLDPLGYGVGVHIGDVMYGNIGSQRRLDFTVIGPAVNVASRLETLTKTVGRPVLLSGDFVRAAGDGVRFEGLGAMDLPGVAEKVEVYALG